MPAELAIHRRGEGRTDAQTTEKSGEHQSESVGAVSDQQGEQMSVHDLGAEDQEARRTRHEAENPARLARVHERLVVGLRLFWLIVSLHGGRLLNRPRGVAAHPNRQAADGEIDERCGPHRSVQAQTRNDEVGGNKRSERSARGVHGVQQGQASARPLGFCFTHPFTRHGLREKGKGQPHCHRGNGHDEHRQDGAERR